MDLGSRQKGPTSALDKRPTGHCKIPRTDALGLAGERAVVAQEQTWLRANGREDLASRVRHVAEVESEGAGYDVASFDWTARNGALK